MNGTEIGLALTDAWEGGGIEQLAVRFFAVAFMPVVRVSCNKFPDIEELTIQTFATEAFDAVAGKLAIGECPKPFGFLLKNVEFSCLSERTRKAQRLDFYQTNDGYVPLEQHQDVSEISYETANLFIDDVHSDLEINDDIAIEVVLLAISQTTPTAQKVLNHILRTDPDYMIGSKFKLGNMSPEASIDLGMTRDAYRAAKSRAFKSLKQNILQIVKEYDLGQLTASESLVNIKRNFGES